MNSLHSMSSLPTQPRIMVKFSVCRLPEELWFLVTKMLSPVDLQQLSMACKRFRYFIIKYPPQPTLRFPDQFPVSPPSSETSNKHYLEIEMKMANTLFVNSENMSGEWAKRVLKHMPNLSVVEIHTLKTKRRVARLLCHHLGNHNNITAIKVHRQDVDRWVAIARSQNLRLHQGVLSLEVNSLLLHVVQEEIPAMANEEHSVLLESFNGFRNTAIVKLKADRRAKLDNFEEALSLNGIIHLEENSNVIYGIDLPTWNATLSTFQSLFTKNPLTSVDKVQLKEMVAHFQNACNDNESDLDEVVEEIGRNKDLTPNMRRCVNMLRNLAELVNSSWKPDKVTEDSLTVIAYDPIAPAFLGKIKHARYFGNDKELSSSKWRKSFQQASNVAGRKPDRSIDITASDGTNFNIYIMEVKTADRSKNRPDLVKLATMLEDNCDFALSHGKDRQSYYSVGLLQEGAKCSVYVMKSPSNFFYVYYLVDEFILPMSLSEMSLLEDVALGFSRCRCLLLDAVSVLNSPSVAVADSDFRLTSTSPKHHVEYYH